MQLSEWLLYGTTISFLSKTYPLNNKKTWKLSKIDLPRFCFIFYVFLPINLVVLAHIFRGRTKIRKPLHPLLYVLCGEYNVRA